ncbi:MULTISPECIES: hypothetical protein [Cysteiniphilum]|uniref:hypothetical protein n=1 Tax=Cysteiniphilum TaxID=2056696 RepID=UPI00177BC26B|nr:MULTISPECIES: hypothetical protein [Cysteiniphilum]
MKHKHQGQSLALRTAKVLMLDRAQIKKIKNDEPTQPNTYEKMLNIKNIKTQPISITPYLRRLCI